MVAPRAEPLTGILLVGGASTRFGSPKALARIGNETLAERAWSTLGMVCAERIAVGKGDEELPFAVVPDGVEQRAPIHGLVAGLRAAGTDVSIVLPVDCPSITPAALRELADACRDAAVPQTGPLPGAYRKSALPSLASGELSIRRVLASLDVAVVHLEERQLLNVNSLDDIPVASLPRSSARLRQ